MKEDGYNDRSGESDSPEPERLSDEEAAEQFETDEEPSLSSPSAMLQAIRIQPTVAPFDPLPTEKESYECDSTVKIDERDVTKNVSSSSKKYKSEEKRVETGSNLRIGEDNESDISEPNELEIIEEGQDEILLGVKVEDDEEEMTILCAPAESSTEKDVHSTFISSDAKDSLKDSREKRGHSKSRERRHSDSRRHHHSSSHYDRRSSKSGSHHAHSSRDHRHRSSHSYRSSRDHDGKGRRSRSRPRTYNLRLQTDYESILQEVRDKNVVQKANTARVPWYPHPRILQYKHRKYFRIETDRNGGADLCHMYWDEICHLSPQLRSDIALEFIKLTYSEDADECAYHVIGIVHDAAAYLPDLVDYMADHYGAITVKTGSLTGRGTQSLTMAKYRDEVYKTYSKGTFRYPPLQEISICGVQGEEVGAYFPDFVGRLETNPCMGHVMPWSSHSVVETDNPRESNDGPIFWVRPGEQTLPSCEGARSKGRIAKGVSRLSEAREALFEDRTKPHADQIGIDGVTTDTAPTAAVGVLKAIVCGSQDDASRATKDVIAFHARDYNPLVDLLQIDVYEPPLKQCPMWLETSKLNSLRRQGIRYAHIQLHGNDVYYLPRKIIHQFQTISAVASVAWHVRWKDYFIETGAPNLHTPTGLNKGAVYHEKKDVPVYEPPVPEDLSDEEIYFTPPKKSEKSTSKTPKTRYKKLISDQCVTPSKHEAFSPPSKVRRLDIDGSLSSRKESSSSEYKSTPSKKIMSSSSSLSTPSRRHSSSAASAASSAQTEVHSGASTSASMPDRRHGSSKSDTHMLESKDKEKDRRHSADDATVHRPLEQKQSLESLSIPSTGKVQFALSDRKSGEDDIQPNIPKTEKPLRENILAKKKRKATAEEKPVSYDVLGDIMQQMDMDKSKTF